LTAASIDAARGEKLGETWETWGQTGRTPIFPGCLGTDVKNLKTWGQTGRTPIFPNQFFLSNRDEAGLAGLGYRLLGPSSSSRGQGTRSYLFKCSHAETWGQTGRTPILPNQFSLSNRDEAGLAGLGYRLLGPSSSSRGQGTRSYLFKCSHELGCAQRSTRMGGVSQCWQIGDCLRL